MKWQDEPALGVEHVRTLARQVAATRPVNPEIWLGLSRALFGLGCASEAKGLLQAGISRVPEAAALRLELARIDMSLGEYEAALAQLSEVRRLDPDNSDAAQLQFLLLYKTGQRKAAATMIEQIAALDSGDPTLFEMWGRDLEDPARLRQLLERCDAALSGPTLATNAVYYRALALAALGRDAEAREALSTEQFVEVSELGAPDGYGDAAAFRSALTEEILRHPTLDPDPRGKSTKGGRQTGELTYPGARAVPLLIGQIQQVVDDYRWGLPADSRLARVCPEQVKLQAWAVVYGRDGHQESHRHPSGWISGVFYVAGTPDGVSGHYDGALRLGVLPDGTPFEPPWGVRNIEPVPGRLVLFPSSMPHATAPPGSNDARITVAFDVLPAG